MTCNLWPKEKLAIERSLLVSPSGSIPRMNSSRAVSLGQWLSLEAIIGFPRENVDYL